MIISNIAREQRRTVRMKLLLRWYDPILAGVLGFVLGGFGFGYVPCTFMDRPDGPCWAAGILGVAATVGSIDLWVSNFDVEMASWVFGAVIVALLVILAARLVAAYVRTA